MSDVSMFDISAWMTATGMEDPGRVAEGWQPVCAVSDRMREDNLWMMTNAVLVLSMNAAFGLLEAGCVAYKNVLNIMMKNLADLTLGGFVWWAYGYAFAFPSMVNRGDNEKWPSFVFDEAFWFFQWTFASTAATIDSGALAERVNFVPYCLLSVTTTGIIYAMVVRMVWDSDGYLLKRDAPFMDFAGGSVVHLVGGVSSIVSTMILGPRIGRFQDYRPSKYWLAQIICRRPVDADYYMVPTGSNPIAPVTDAVSMIWGVFFLWIGWYGFNTGGVGEIEGSGTYVVGRVTVNTTFGAVGGGCMAFLVDLVLFRGKVHAENLAMGILGGLVSITAGCYWFGNGVSFMIGAMGDLVAVAAKLALEWFRIDDVVSAFPIHGACGAFGAIAIAFFAEDYECSGNTVKGLFFAKTDEEVDYAWKLLGTQVWGVVVIIGWTAITTFSLIFLLNQIPCLRFRLSRDIELKGVDEVEHRMPHENLDMQLVFKHMLESLASCTGKMDQIMGIFSNAAACMTIAHKMKDLRDTYTHRKDQTLIVQLHSLEGINFRVRPQLTRQKSYGINTTLSFITTAERGWTVAVEIVAAAAPKAGEEHYTREFSYFAPRISTSAHIVEDDKAEWPDDEFFSFGNFLIPPGGEDHIFVCFSIHNSGRKFAEAYAPIKAKDWKIGTGGLLTGNLSLPLVPHGPNAVSPPASSKLNAEISIPADSRLSQSLSRHISEITIAESFSHAFKHSLRDSTVGYGESELSEPRCSLPNDRVAQLEQKVAALTSMIEEMKNKTSYAEEDAV